MSSRGTRNDDGRFISGYDDVIVKLLDKLGSRRFATISLSLSLFILAVTVKVRGVFKKTAVETVTIGRQNTKRPLHSTIRANFFAYGADWICEKVFSLVINCFGHEVVRSTR